MARPHSDGLGERLDTGCGFPGTLEGGSGGTSLTGYYSAGEDLDIDLAALADGNLQFCGNNIGNEGNSASRKARTVRRSA